MKFPLMRNNILREDLDAMIEHLKNEDPILTNGPNVRDFESAWSAWLGVRYSVFVSSGTAANQLTMTALKLNHPEGGEILVPALTWVSDVVSVIQNGFTPVFVDIDPQTLSMNPTKILNAVNKKTKAVFITHAQGFDGLTDELVAELDARGVPLIEDVCESHGAKHGNKRLGSIGWVSNFSFYYAHHLSTIEGGMVCTNDSEVYSQLRMLRSHGMVREVDDPKIKKHYQDSYPELNPDFIFAHAGYNFRNTELGAILGLSQLKRLDKNIDQRTRNFHQFLNQIDSKKFRTDFKTEGSSNYAFNLVLTQENRGLVQNLMEKMRNAGIEFRRGSAGGGNQLRQPYLEKHLAGQHYADFPETEHIHFYGFYIGNFPDLTKEEIDQICNVLNSASP
jgi:CDP-4-dehydro-6-deoxyglucose reductase, E1